MTCHTSHESHGYATVYVSEKAFAEVAAALQPFPHNMKFHTAAVGHCWIDIGDNIRLQSEAARPEEDPAMPLNVALLALARRYRYGCDGIARRSWAPGWRVFIDESCAPHAFALRDPSGACWGWPRKTAPGSSISDWDGLGEKDWYLIL